MDPTTIVLNLSPSLIIQWVAAVVFIGLLAFALKRR
jgi:hypothetical protein